MTDQNSTPDEEANSAISRNAPARIDPAYDLMRFEETSLQPSLAARFLEAARLAPGAALKAGGLALTNRPMRAGNILRSVAGTGLQRAPASVCEAASRISRQAVEGEPPAGLSLSYIVAVEGTAAEAAAKILHTVASFRAQDWAGASLWIVSSDRRLSGDVLPALANEPARIFAHFRQGASYAALMQDAAAKCGSGLIIRLDAGDALQPQTSRALALAAGRNPNAQAFYSDEAVVTLSGRYMPPLLKPAFCADYLMAINYTGPFLAVRHDAFMACQGLAADLGKAAWSDLLLKIAAGQGDAAIAHIPEPLVIRTRPDEFPRIASGEAARQLQARQQVAQRHISRLRRNGSAHIDHDSGIVETHWAMPKSPPLASVIVPTRDRLDLLRMCIEGLSSMTDYRDREIIVVDNASKKSETQEYLNALAASGMARVLRDSGEFNHSRLNNMAVREANGSVMIFLNNDVEMIDAAWASHLVAYALRPETGAAGALLYYPDGKVQHAGIVTGIKGTAGHAHQYFKAAHTGYMHRLRAPHEVSAVTAACMAIRKEVFFRAGGFDETEFPVSFNDVDLCLTLRRHGYRNMFVPQAKLIHHESATRKTAEKRESIRNEAERLIAKWGTELAADPFYSRKFNHNAPDFSLDPALPRAAE